MRFLRNTSKRRGKARRPADPKRTYGFDRVTVLAAFVNGLTLVAVATECSGEAPRYCPLDWRS